MCYEFAILNLILNLKRVLPFVQLLLDYDDLRRIPYLKAAMEDLTNETVKLRLFEHWLCILCYAF